jgi:hypothetical protein
VENAPAEEKVDTAVVVDEEKLVPEPLEGKCDVECDVKASASPVTDHKRSDEKGAALVTEPVAVAKAPCKDEVSSTDEKAAPSAVPVLNLKGPEKGKAPDRKSGRKKSARQPSLPLTARSKRSLLGDLPSLERPAGAADARNFLECKLEVPKGKKDKAKPVQASVQASAQASAQAAGAAPASGVPLEFACAINGHMMKDPVRSPGGIMFEKATIVLWLSTRGSICPITGAPLSEGDLIADAKLRTKIMRHHISKSMEKAEGPKVDDDDMYDF